MSIASAIATKQQQVTAAYTAAEAKGATLPATQNLTNLATCISSISSGGSTRFGLSLDNYIGQVNNGTLQAPTTFPNSITFTGVETVAQSALYETFESDNNINTVSFPDLVTIEASGLCRCFYGASISSCSFPDLVTIDTNGLEYAFGNTRSLRSMTFPNLTTIYSGGLQDTFITAGIRELYFPALTTAYSSSFSDMLRAVSGVTVHFPFSMQSTMSSWSSVTNGFGGKNTTILFDLNGCEVTFAITPNSGNRLIVNGDELSSNIITVAKSTTMNYQIYNSSYGLYISDYMTPDASTATVTTDITVPTYNTISLDTEVSGLTATITVDSTNYTLTEVGSSGVYTLSIYKTVSNSVTINYFVNGGSSYADATGTLTFNNSDISETITMQPAQDISFTRPDLKANGTMGGDSFAVKSGTLTTAWRAVDSSSTTYANISNGNSFIFYNPDALKVSELDFVFSTSTSTTYSPIEIVIEGSDDDTNWTQVSSWSGESSASLTVNVNSSAYYKYHKLTMTPFVSSIRIYNLGITAVYKG